LLCRRVRNDLFDVDLVIIVPKRQLDSSLCLCHLGFDIDMGEGKHRVHEDRWEALKSKRVAILSAKGGESKPAISQD